MRMSNDELTPIDVIFCAETAKAIGFWKSDQEFKDGAEPTWFSKKVAVLLNDRGRPRRGESAVIEAPAWLLEKEGLA